VVEDCQVYVLAARSALERALHLAELAVQRPLNIAAQHRRGPVVAAFAVRELRVRALLLVPVPERDEHALDVGKLIGAQGSAVSTFAGSGVQCGARRGRLFG
jgi:hypothetical protein